MATFVQRSPMPVPARELYEWHARAGAFERLAPPWESIDVVERHGSIRDGDVLVMRLSRGPLSLRWRAVHEEHVEGRQFVDRQERGPFAHWRHRHRFLEAEHGSVLEDSIEYRLPLDAVAQAVAGGRVRSRLQRMFDFRHRRTRRDLTRHRGVKARRVGITGADTPTGVQLRAFLGTGGHHVVPLEYDDAAACWAAPSRSPEGKGADVIDLEAGRRGVDPAAAAGLDAVIHLDGMDAAGRHRGARRSRKLARGLASLDQRPECLVVLSSVLAYDGQEGEIDEGGPAGDTPIARSCVARESATATARDAGMRVLVVRSGAVASITRGWLASLHGLHGLRIRPRSMPDVSWISLDDLLGCLLHGLRCRELEGVVHAVAPGAGSSDEVQRALDAARGHSARLRLPVAPWRRGHEPPFQGPRTESARIVPGRLPASGFEYLDPDLTTALRFELGHPPGGQRGKT